MMRSLYSGISGLRNHQTRMDVIGNNISNVNTAGYKTARVIFQDIFSQNVAAGMANQGNIGGTNPIQIGLGIRLSSVDVIHSRAAFGRTDKETDMMINGDGFFIVMQENPETGEQEMMYTRAGNFAIDSEGYLVTTHGYFVMGYTVDPMMGIVNTGQAAVAGVTRIQVQLNDYDFGDIIAAGDLAAGVPENAFTFYAVGATPPAGTIINGAPVAANYTIAANDVITVPARTLGPDQAQFTYTTGANGNAVPARLITVRNAVQRQDFKPPIFGLVQSGNPDGNMQLEKIRVVSDVYQAINWDMLQPANQNALTPMVAALKAAEDNEDWDAYMAAQAQINEYITANLGGFPLESVGLPGFAVANNGDVSVIIANRAVVIGRIALAMFANPEGLEKAGNSLYRETASSGPVVVTEAYNEGAGQIDAGGLEMSNVDLADQFTDMIVTQRGFQANSRIITVSDTMLEELVNLKR